MKILINTDNNILGEEMREPLKATISDASTGTVNI
jgi:hypothetical protein